MICLCRVREALHCDAARIVRILAAQRFRDNRVMAAPAGSSSDLATAIEIAQTVRAASIVPPYSLTDPRQDILDVYFDGLVSAPPPLVELLCTIKFIHDVLVESIGFLSQCNRTFLGQERFSRKLAQCRDFVQRNCTLVHDSAEPKSPTTADRLWQLDGPPDVEMARTLNDGLQVEMEKLITFIFLVAL